MNLFEKTLKEELIYKGDYLTYTKVTVELPDGNTANRDILHHPGACAIIPFIDDDKIILINQFRKALDKTILEIPAGKINKDENIKDCALRELEEETGYKANNITYLGGVVLAPGYCDEVIHLYKATDLQLNEKHEDFDEFTEVKIFPLDEVKQMIKEGKIIDAKTISAITYISI